MAKQSVYTVVDGPLDHDGKRYDNGDFVELDDKTAERLEGIVAKGKVQVDEPSGQDANPQG